MPTVKDTFKSALLQGARLVGGSFPSPPGALVLTYHAVGRQHLPYTISLELFRAQIDRLIDQGRRFVTVAELGSHMTRGDLSPEMVCITFDDAFVNAVEAIDWLVSRGGKATLFAVTGAPRHNHWDAADAAIPRMERMSGAQLRSLHAAGVEIGSHTVNHRRLTELGDLELYRELIDSRQTLEKLVQVAPRSLAYPYGAFDGRVAKRAAQAGYRWGCTTQYAYVTGRENPLLIPRMEPDSLEDLDDLAAGRSHLYYRVLGAAHRFRNRLARDR